MKMIYAILGLLFFGGLAFYLISYKNKSLDDKKVGQRQDSTQRNPVQPKNNPYNDLRDMALSATAEKIGVQLPMDQTKIYGIIMDWDLGEGTVTLVSFISGDASLYLSSGGGFIGGGGHENVKEASRSFINKAETYLSKTNKTDVTPLPDKNGVNFYFLTNKGKFVAQEEVKNVETNSSEWADLFDEANKLITEIRISSENK